MTVARRDPEKADLVYGDVMVGREGIEPSTNGLKIRRTPFLMTSTHLEIVILSFA